MLDLRVTLGVLALPLIVSAALTSDICINAQEESAESKGTSSATDAVAQTQPTGKPAQAEKNSAAIVIPLENIWGHDRSLRGLEPELFIKRNTPEKRAQYSTPEKLQEIRDKAESSLAYQIERAMSDDLLDTDPDFKKRRPAPGFAVVGRDREALAGIHEVVVGGKEPQSKFSDEDEISLVFFTLTTNAGVRLIHAERIGTKFNIHYVLIITGTLGISPRLYIIPVGKLPPGEYEVNLVRVLKEELKYGNKGFPTYEKGVEESFVCEPFQFVVLEDSPNGKGAE